ncbi:MAG: hypothetical protein ABJJ37_16915 [Roseibium sp.]
MYNPNEAKEDGYALRVAILFFAAVGVLISIYFHSDSATKYWLLSNFGQQTSGTIINIDPAADDYRDLKKRGIEDPRNFLKNIETWVTGDRIEIEFTPLGGPKFRFTLTLAAEMIGRQVTENIAVIYLPANPKISYLSEHLSDFSFDSKIMLWSLLTGLGILWLGHKSIRSWLQFRQKMRRY